MNVERLHAILRAIADEAQLHSETLKLGQLIDALGNMASQPGTNEFQQSVAQVREEFIEGLRAGPVDSWPAAWQEILTEIGVRDLFGEPMVQQVENAFQRHEVTPAAISTELQHVHDRLTDLETRIDRVSEAFDAFGLGHEQLEPGEVEITVLIPRDAVHSDLNDLGREFQKLHRIFGPFAEAVTGSRTGFEVRAISSSEFGIFLNSVPGMVLSLSVALSTLLGTYKQFLEIRQISADLRARKVPETAITPLGEHVDTMMAEAVSRAVDDVIERADAVAEDRINELRLDLQHALEDIARRIDAGYDFDVRGEPEAREEEDEAPQSELDNTIARINAISPQLKFIERPGRGLLSIGSAPGEAEDDEAAGSSDGS